MDKIESTEAGLKTGSGLNTNLDYSFPKVSSQIRRGPPHKHFAAYRLGWGGGGPSYGHLRARLQWNRCYLAGADKRTCCSGSL